MESVSLNPSEKLAEDKDYDFWLIGIAVLCLVLSTVLILDDRILFRPKSKGIGAAIAFVSNASNDVRRRGSAELAYASVRDLDELYVGDSVFTGSESNVKIKYQKGSEISISPDSLIALEGDGERGGLDVKKGNISATLNKNDKFLVKVGNENALLTGDNATIKLSKSSDGSTSINVQSGKLNISDSRGTLTLKENQEARLKEGEETISVEHLLELSNPVENAQVWARPSEKISLSWRGVLKGEVYKLTIAADEDFQKVYFTNRISVKEYPNISVQVANLPFETSLYWKVEGLSQKTSSFTRKFNIHREGPIELLNPEDGKRFLMTDLKDGAILFDWTGNPHGGYEVQISQDPKFRQLIFAKEINRNSFKLSPEADGLFYWRVRNKASTNTEASWSVAKVFKFGPERALAAPELPNQIIRYLIDESK